MLQMECGVICSGIAHVLYTITLVQMKKGSGHFCLFITNDNFLLFFWVYGSTLTIVKRELFDASDASMISFSTPETSDFFRHRYRLNYCQLSSGTLKGAAHAVIARQTIRSRQFTLPQTSKDSIRASASFHGNLRPLRAISSISFSPA